MHSFIDALFRYRLLILVITLLVLTLALFLSLSIYKAQFELSKVDIQKLKKMVVIDCYLLDTVYNNYESHGVNIVRYHGKEKPTDNATCAIAKPLFYPFGYWQLSYDSKIKWVHSLSH